MAAASQQSLAFDVGSPLSLEPVRPVSLASRDASIAERFAAFHAANPHVNTAIVGLARHVNRVYGLERCSMRALFEELRWQHRLATRGEAWLLNNVFTAEYARLVMRQEPDLAGFFETRALVRKK